MARLTRKMRMSPPVRRRCVGKACLMPITALFILAKHCIDAGAGTWFSGVTCRATCARLARLPTPTNWTRIMSRASSDAAMLQPTLQRHNSTVASVNLVMSAHRVPHAYGKSAPCPHHNSMAPPSLALPYTSPPKPPHTHTYRHPLATP